MPYQNIDASLSAVDEKAVKDAFAAVLEKLPFLVKLTIEERRGGVKTGPDSLSFVQNCRDAVVETPGIFPPSFDQEGFKRDVELFNVLTTLNTIAASVASQIDDTRVAVGSEAMQQATQVYNYVKTAEKTTPGLKPLVDQLGERFKRANKKPPTTPPTT